MSYSRYIPKRPTEQMSVNTEVKGTLAKLLATENLHVEHRKISTAYFNTETRVLALPIWKDVTGDVYDLLVGHEVGHALYTPNIDFDNAPKDYVNVIEDARVEQKMKHLYPGLRKSFYLGYQELNKKDFFNLRSTYKKLSDWKLIDRINIYFKVGTVCNDLPLNFNAEEQVWVDRIANAETYEEVLQLAEELYAWVKDDVEQNPDVPTPPTKPNNSTSADGDREYSPQSSDQKEDTDGSSDSNPTGGNDKDIDSDLDDVDDNLDQSDTERAWNDNQYMLIDDDAKEWIYLDLPEVNLDKVVVPYKVIQTKLENYFMNENVDGEAFTRSVDKTTDVYKKYKHDAQSSVNYLVKQFEMKKSADKYSRSSESRTGVINTNALYKYKLTDDIFVRSNVVSDGKNHGLMFLLDWSGSMANCMMDTIKQLYNLIWFCRKVQIPFEVYAFQSTMYGEYSQYGDNHKAKRNTLGISKSFRLLQLFTSGMKTKELDDQMLLIWIQCYGMCCSYYTAHSYCREYTLGGTPLAEAVICIRELVSKFTKNKSIQKVNVIALTDGESNPMFYNAEKLTTRYGDEYWNTSLLCHNLNKVFILRDPVTGYQRRIEANPYLTTKEIVSFYREITDYNWIGFRLCSKREANTMISFYGNDSQEYHTSWSKNKFIEIHNKCGFTVQYLMPNQNIGFGTNDLEVKPKKEVASKAELTRAFKKHMGSKMTNKTILNKFVEVIA